MPPQIVALVWVGGFGFNERDIENRFNHLEQIFQIDTEYV